MANPHSVN